MLALGIDEVGRGSLAGPVVAAGVVLDASKPIEGLNDSKRLSPKKREELSVLIHERALFVSIALVDAQTIDRINIFKATYMAMEKVVVDAAAALSLDLIMVDGNQLIPTKLAIKQSAIVKGDSLIPAIMAASIVAKVYRDSIMNDYFEQYPEYGFQVHKGYGTKAHREAIKLHGPSPIHRRSFMSMNQLELL
jgi:ribonuclease HII